MKKKEALQAVLAEPELPGDMPPFLRARIREAVQANDWESMNEFMRAAVRATKSGIYDRIKNYQRAHSATGER